MFWKNLCGGIARGITSPISGSIAVIALIVMVFPWSIPYDWRNAQHIFGSAALGMIIALSVSLPRIRALQRDMARNYIFKPAREREPIQAATIDDVTGNLVVYFTSGSGRFKTEGSYLYYSEGEWPWHEAGFISFPIRASELSRFTVPPITSKIIDRWLAAKHHEFFLSRRF